MTNRFILELNPLDSLESNMEFLRKCEKQIQDKKEKLKGMRKVPKNQVDLEESIEEIVKQNPQI